MNLMAGKFAGAEDDYEQLCYLLLHHGELEKVCEKCENVIDIIIEKILDKIDVENTDENYMKFMEGILFGESFDEVCSKFKEKMN